MHLNETWMLIWIFFKNTNNCIMKHSTILHKQKSLTTNLLNNIPFSSTITNEGIILQTMLLNLGFRVEGSNKV